MVSAKKKNLGQFFTKNSDYILQDLQKYVKNKVVVDPFAGNQDLMRWAKKNNCKNAVGFDCDQNLVEDKKVFLNDSINSPKKYKFVCTNPPYLHKNKASQEVKEKLKENILFDLISFFY